MNLANQIICPSHLFLVPRLTEIKRKSGSGDEKKLSQSMCSTNKIHNLTLHNSPNTLSGNLSNGIEPALKTVLYWTSVTQQTNVPSTAHCMNTSLRFKICRALDYAPVCKNNMFLLSSLKHGQKSRIKSTLVTSVRVINT